MHYSEGIAVETGVLNPESSRQLAGTHESHGLGCTVCPSAVRLSASLSVCPYVPLSSALLRWALQRLAPSVTAMSLKTWICFYPNVECGEATKKRRNKATNSGTCTVNRSHICEMSPSPCSHPLYAKCKSLASKSLQVAHKLCQRNFFRSKVPPVQRSRKKWYSAKKWRGEGADGRQSAKESSTEGKDHCQKRLIGHELWFMTSQWCGWGRGKGSAYLRLSRRLLQSILSAFVKHFWTAGISAS